jgi:serine protease Do
VKPVRYSYGITTALLAGGAAISLITGHPAGAQVAQNDDRQISGIVPRAGAPGSFADLTQQLQPAVVNISTRQRIAVNNNPLAGTPFADLFGDRGGGAAPTTREAQSLGSGFIITADGYVVTNNHVIQPDAGRAQLQEVTVTMPDGTEYPAEVVGTDPQSDLAVLKINRREPFPFVHFGNSGEARVGDWVIAIGNPFGLGGTVTVGIVSARNRDINSGPYDDFIQTDAAINRGNSGGPLFNMNGEVVGINTAIISPSGGSIGIGFSIPAKLAAGVVGQLREFGQTSRGWLGVRIQEVSDEIAESLGMATAKGALVSGIIKGGPVDNGVVQAGDVIIKFDGRDIKAMNDLPRAVAESPVGKVVDVVIVREGTEQTVKVTLGRLEDGEKLASAETDEGKLDQGDNEAPVATASVLGMTIGELNEELRKQFGISEDVSGVVVTEVNPNSPAGEKGVTAGDVIAEIAQESVSTPKEVLDRITALKGQGRKSALLMLASKSGELRFVPVPMN